MPDDTTKGSGQDAHKALFAGLVMMLGSSAMQQLGKLVDPSSGKSAISLEGAQSTIDVLDMLQAKTQGNLDAAEEKMLRDLLASLQMNYVQVAEAARKTPSSAAMPTEPVSQPSTEQPADKTPASAQDISTTASATASDEKEVREPRFHKSYDA